MSDEISTKQVIGSVFFCFAVYGGWTVGRLFFCGV
jgi:hypothetical protein